MKRLIVPLLLCLSSAMLTQAQTESFWSTSTVPANTVGNDSSSVELGLRFSANVTGNITGARVYCAANSSGSHSVHLWSATGTSLATATLPACSGWTAVNFANPLAATAGSAYTISYHTTQYPWNTEFFTSSITSGNLKAPVNAGVYAYGNSPSFPSSTWEACNYWVDVLFTPATGTPTYTVSGTIGGVGGASVALSGASSGSTVANGSGAYSFSGLANGAYTVTPTLSGYTFTPTSQSITVNGANATVPAFTATVTRYTISGTISGVGGASVALSGASSGSTVANHSGAYSFSGLSNGAYTVTPTLSGYTFTPPSQSITVNGANAIIPAFTATATRYTISGTISGVGGATVALGGASSGSTVANGSGAYSFSGLANGAYTVTPTLSGYTFTPPSQSITINGANSSVPAFTATAVVTTYSISGTISPSSVGSNATISLSGAASATTTANASGNYTFTGLANGNYTVTTSETGYTFSPDNAKVTISGANLSGVNFTAQAVTSGGISIDASVSTDNSSASSTISSPLFSTATGNELLLAFVSSDYGSGANTTVTSVSGGGLTWVLVVRTNVQNGTAEIWRAFTTASLSNVSVTATVSQSVVSSMTVMSFEGVDTTGTNGSGAIGATATGNGNPGAPSASLTTTRNNSWVFGVGNDWDNALNRTPGTGQILIHQDLSPANDTYWVQSQSSSTALAGSAVTISDTAPTSDRYNLSICEILPAVTGGGAPTWSISGTISPASTGSGATVTLSGAANATTTADASGNYSFTGLASGSGYVVTPLLLNVGFSPNSLSLTINGANLTGENFASGGCGNQTPVTGAPNGFPWTDTSCQMISGGQFLTTAVVNQTPTSNAWTIISRHGEYAQGETECNIPGAWSVSPGALTVTNSTSSYTCGNWNASGTSCPASGCAGNGANSGASSFPYSTGDVQWNTFSFLYGTLEFEATYPQITTSTAWPAHWMLATNCQTANAYSGDPNGACPNYGSQGYDEIDLLECYSGVCGFHIYHNDTGQECSINAPDNNPHKWRMSWAPGSLVMAMDGTNLSGCSFSSNIPAQPMFLIIQTQTGGPEAPNPKTPNTMTTNYVKVCNSSYTAAQCSAAAPTDPNVIFYDNFTSNNP